MFMLMFHIVVAVSGLLMSTILYLKPSKTKYNLSSGFLAMTLVSGAILVVANPVTLVKSCILGLAYTAFVVSMLYLSSKKLALYTIKKK